MKKYVSALEYALPVTITPLEEGGFLARCNALQGCMAEGETIEQALSYIVDVAKQIIDLRREEKMDIPLKVVKKVTTKSKVDLLMPLLYQPSHA